MEWGREGVHKSRGCECSVSAEVMTGARLFIVILLAVEAAMGVVVAVIGITAVVCTGNDCGVSII